MVTTSPSQRTRSRTRRTRYTEIIASAPAEANSYMFPHGIRSSANPRVVIDATCNAQPSTVNATAARPTRSYHGRAVNSGGEPSVTDASAETGAPAPTSTRSGTAAAAEPTTRPRPLATSAAYANIAST